MCGIAGIISANPEHRNKIYGMNDRLVHRGPDAGAVYVDDHVALGHRRLSIIDLSPAGSQPMWSSDGRYCIVYNGEVYNYLDLKRELKEFTFRGNSDTEVVLNVFIKYGVAAFEKLNGIFAFAIYDKIAQKTYLVRDRFAIKPLYYAHVNGALIFASELRAILETGLVSRKVNKLAVIDYFRFTAVGSPISIVEEINQLPAGHYAILENNVLQVNRYRELANVPQIEVGSDYETIQNKTRDLLLRAVERQLVSDVPLGAFLSGGIDSSSIVALMAEVTDRRIHTFNISFGEQEFDESAYATLVSNKFNTEHSEFRLRPLDLLEILPDALAAQDTPSVDGINTYLISKITKEAGVTVALSGLGGDELFAGYAGFKQFKQLNSNLLYRVPVSARRPIARTLQPWMTNSKIKRMFNMASYAEPALRNIYPYFRTSFDDVTLSKMMPFLEVKSQNLQQINLAQIQSYTDPLPFFSQFSMGEMYGYTQNVLLKDSDQMSMASALELRVPFFDNDLFDYVMNVPDHIKLSNGVPKSLLVHAVGTLPDDVVLRKKMGFTFPWEHWIKYELAEMCDRSIHNLVEQGVVSNEVVDLYHKFKKDIHFNWVQVWLFVVLDQYIAKLGLSF